MLTRRGKYGLKAMLTLTREHGLGPMLIGDLAEADAIPKKFLEIILLSLTARFAACSSRSAMKPHASSTARRSLPPLTRHNRTTIATHAGSSTSVARDDGRPADLLRLPLLLSVRL